MDEVFRQVQNQPDVTDILILNAKGNPIKTTMDSKLAIENAGLYQILLNKAISSVQKINPDDELIMLRVRTISHETLITPDGKITVLVTQVPQDRFHT